MQGNFHFVFKGPKYLIPLALKLRMIVVLPCSILNLSNFSWYKHTLVLLMLVYSLTLLSLCCFFSYDSLHYFFSPFLFLFLHLHVQPYLFFSYLMIIILCSKKRVCAQLNYLADASFFFLMRLHIFKGGPIHKPIILASSGSLTSSFIYLLNNLYGKIIIKPINQFL